MIFNAQYFLVLISYITSCVICQMLVVCIWIEGMLWITKKFKQKNSLKQKKWTWTNLQCSELVHLSLLQGYGVEDGAFCAVFDGHGKNGHTVSKIVKNKLPSLLLSQRNSIAKIIHSSKMGSDQSKNFLRWKDACMTAFKAVDRELKFLPTLDCSCSGTTAAVVIRQVTGTSMLPYRVNTCPTRVTRH